MCGIAGILHFNDKPVVVAQIKSMTDILAHRGPDGEGQFVEGSIGLGHRRLSVIDLTSAGAQPMQTNDERYVITYNGEVYNFKELRKELISLGHQFNSNTDSEVVLNAFSQWQEGCLGKLNGMFAFAIWDKSEKRLFLARDRYGIKPLYYYLSNTKLVFSSEVKGIIDSKEYSVEVNREGFVEYLTFQNFFTENTLFQDIKILMPGYYVFIDKNGNFISNQYWDFNFTDSIKISKDEAIEETDRLFKQAVHRQLIGDVPVNSYLSGGIDSGAITMVASKLLPEMKTFTIGFDLTSASGLELSCDERQKAEHMSYLAETEHYEMVLKAGDMERCMEQYVWHLEEPRVGQSYPNYYAAKLASKFGKVVLSGCGGDELFGGYPWRYMYQSSTNNSDNFIDEYYLKWQRLISNTALKKLINPIINDVEKIWTRDIFYNVFNNNISSINTEDPINNSLYLEAKTFLHGLLVVEDKLSMSFGLETRVPFLDNDLVDFAQKIPHSLQIDSLNQARLDENFHISKVGAKNTNGKKILKEVFRRYVNDESVLFEKQGFSAPDGSWFKGESIDFIKKELRNTVLDQYFDMDYLTKLLAEHYNGTANRRLFVWSVLYIHFFLKRFIG